MTPKIMTVGWKMKFEWKYGYIQWLYIKDLNYHTPCIPLITLS